MKKMKITAFILSAALSLTSAAGCSNKSSSKKTPENNGIGIYEHNVNISEESNVNDTAFTLNSVIDAGVRTDDGKHYIYLDVTIKNISDVDYELSSLNNFYLIMPDGKEISSHVSTQLYATNNFNDRYSPQPYNIPVGEEFSSVIGGFILNEGQNEFTVGFFPTKNDDKDKANVIKIKVSPDDIIPLPNDLLK